MILHLNTFFFVDFDRYEKEDLKLKDFRDIYTETDWKDLRLKFTEDKEFTQYYCDIPLFHCPDLIISADDDMIRNRLYEEVSKNE